MAIADCECCGVPTMVGAPVFVEPEECDCDCYDCDDCDECYHDDEPAFVTPAVLCHYCVEDGPDGCLPGAWHCRCGRACDGSACPGEPEPFRNGSVYDRDLRGSDDGGAP